MIYQLHEFHKNVMAPAVVWADAARQFFTHPFSPLAYVPGARTLAAGSELFVRLLRRYPKPQWNIEHTVVDGETVVVRREVALAKPFCELLHFRKETKHAHPKLLIVAPLSGHFATLLRDTVRTALPDFDVWITDWVDAKMVPLPRGPFHLDDYVDYVREFIRFLAPDVNVMSVCQPTVPVLGAVSLMAASDDPALPRTMVMMGGPIDTRRNPTAVNDFAQGRPHSWFADKVIMRVPPNYPGFMRKVYPGFLQHASFLAMNPDRHLDSHWRFYMHLVRGDGESAEAHRRFYDEYNAVLDMPAEYYLDTIKVVFQEFQLPKGQWRVRGEPVRPEAIAQTSLFTIEGELDDISGNGQTEAAHALCRAIPAERRRHLLARGVGHYGIFSGRKFRETIYPQIREFIFQQTRQQRALGRLRLAR
ncbi:MAG TPA: polyhydroxyalkanoate depolymerase [Burkholderiales bacterium]|jgi:poly(3-hydroxybutyrate) depolymerase|nr:polyhydroxyalkanoate depolymerase [Burkholderiales bacterium]